MTRRLRYLSVLCVAVLALGAAADDNEWTATTGGWVSGPVEYVDTIATEAGGAVDAVLHDDLLYVTSWRSFSIHDVSDPTDPTQLSLVPLVVGVYNEQPQTNGEILLISRDVQYLPPNEHQRGGGVLDIYDVSDPRKPEYLSTYESELVGEYKSHRDHLWTCIRDCAYAYGAGGTILDLSDPAAPTKVGDWRERAPVDEEDVHYIARVAPGIVMTGSNPMYVLDTREDPTSPALLATIDPDVTPIPPPVAGFDDLRVTNKTSLPARLAWPSGLNGRLSVVTMETPFLGNCTEVAGEVKTYLTPGWRDRGTFDEADTYQIAENGTYTDGRPPYNALGCSAYGLDVHPAFAQNGGPIAVTFFEHGVRILGVDAQGRITELGRWLPAGGNSVRPIWLSDELLYVMDLQRGIDILRIDTAGA